MYRLRLRAQRQALSPNAYKAAPEGGGGSASFKMKREIIPTPPKDWENAPMLKQTLCGCAAVAILAMATTAASAADKRDLTGLWSNQSLTSLQRPAGITALEVSADEAKRIVDGRDTIGFTSAETKNNKVADVNAPLAAGDKDFGVKAYDPAWTSAGDALGKVGGHYRTSQVIQPADGHIPYKDPEGAKQKAIAGGIRYATGNGPFDGPEQAGISERCFIGFGNTGGPGMLNTLYNNNYSFVQTKDYLAIDVEMAHDVRVIPIFASAQKAKASHGPATIKRWLGDSVAWWEGNTLVVESINVPPLQGRSGSFPMSAQAKVTEYLTRTSDKEILYKFTVEDAENYTQPWTAELTFHPSPAIYEYACHEGNYGLEGILAGARAKDAERTSASK
jgi:hypothetical protein